MAEKTKVDQQIDRLKNHGCTWPFIFIAVVVLAIAGFYSVLKGAFFDKTPPPEIKQPRLEADMVVESLSDSLMYYYFVISNSGEAPAKNLLYSVGAPDMFRDILTPIRGKSIDLQPGAKVKFDPNPIMSKVPYNPYFGYLLLVKYRDGADSLTNCLFEYHFRKGELKVGSFISNITNCEPGWPSPERINRLYRNTLRMR